MKFKQEFEIEIKWGLATGALVDSNGHVYRHERDLPQEWPRDAINYATKLIHVNRKLEKANTIEDVTEERKWPSPQWVCPIIPPSQFKGRKFTVTFSDAGPIGGES